jgi:hypothetical protein
MTSLRERNALQSMEHISNLLLYLFKPHQGTYLTLQIDDESPEHHKLFAALGSQIQVTIHLLPLCWKFETLI